MKKATLVCGLLLTCASVFAQFGITSRYQINEAKDWKITYADQTTEKILGDAPAIGVDYWFRLKNYRVEFLPELSFSNYNNKFQIFENISREVNINTYNLFLNTNFYVFDFLGDCDCPTWSKQGSFAQKGFFLQVSPGVSYFQQEVKTERPASFESNALALSLGVGMGLDIGITDLITFTPMVGARYFPKVEWASLDQFDDGLLIKIKNPESSISQLYAGARLGFRFDYQSSRRR